MATKSAIITGAGSGIGRAAAISLANAGFHVILCGRRKSALAETRKLLTSPDSHTMLPLDVTRPDEMKDALGGADLERRNLAVVISNAGVAGENTYGPDDRWEEVMATNLSGPYYFVNQCLPALKQSDEEFRHVIVISSIMAKMNYPGFTAYCASKAGVLALVRVWARELGSENILVNAICPGWVETALAIEGSEKASEQAGISYHEMLKMQMAASPLNRISDPSEVAEFIGFLVSNRQSTFTGESFDMNNGILMG